MDYIAEGLRELAVEIETLVPDPANVRVHPARNVEAMKASLRKFGQLKPVVVQKQGMIVRAGNATMEAAKQLGWTHIAATVEEMDDLTATAFAIADNRTAELAEWDLQGLGKLITELDAVDGTQLEALGFDEGELQNLMAAEWHPPDAEGDLGDHGSEPGTDDKNKADEGHQTIVVSTEAFEVIEQAVKRQRDAADEPLTIGNALLLICEAWLDAL